MKGMQYSTGVIGLLILSVRALAAPTLSLGIRGNEAAVELFSRQQGHQVLNSETKEFPNGNTFVRFLDDVAGRPVAILIPKTLTADQWMELLIKVRTARTNGATNIRVLFPCPYSRLTILKASGKKLHLPILSMLSVAGANEIQIVRENSPPVDIRAFDQKPITSLKDPGGPAFVLSKHHETLGEEIAQSLGLPHLQDSDLISEQLIDHPGTAFVIAASTSPVNETFFDALEEVKKFEKARVRTILAFANFPYARSDKKDQPGVTTTARLIADMIELMGTDAVSFVRAHAPQTEGFFSIPTFHITGRKTINDFLRRQEVEVVASPDAGFQKDATLYANELEVKLIVLNKERNLATGEAKLHDSGIEKDSLIDGKIVALIDDETASGSTLALAAEHLKAKGAKKVIAVVTHLTGNAKKALESDAIDLVVVTNTLPIPSNNHLKFKVLSVGQEIANGLRNLISGSDPKGCIDSLVRS